MILPHELMGGEEKPDPLGLKSKPMFRQIQAGDRVLYAGSEWEVAHVKQFPHGLMIGIYDEPPGKHVDYLKPSSVTLISHG